MPNWMSTTCELVGFGCVVFGASMIAVPLGFIVAGVLLIAAGVMAA